MGCGVLSDRFRLSRTRGKESRNDIDRVDWCALFLCQNPFLNYYSSQYTKSDFKVTHNA
jgi:hypothetical protein